MTEREAIKQIDCLAEFIMKNIEGEPSKSEGAVECAIRLLEKQMGKNPTTVTERSNVIQYDSMGYPLRLVITSKGEQIWLDSYHEKEDVVLKWSEVEGLK